jgi:type VI protein secretion system component VasF
MSHANHPPELPEVTDEAGDSPGWLPLLGLALFALVVAYIWWAHRQHEALEQGSAEAAEGAP